MALLLALGAAADAAADSTKYLLFDVIPHEQLNKQRRAYMFYLDLARRLQRTLVLPRGRLVKRDAYGRFLNDEAEYVRWGELFNLTTLNELHPAVELETFLEEGNEVSHMIKIDHKGCEGGGKGTVDFNGLSGVPVGKFSCGAGLQYNIGVLFSKFKDLPSIGFSHSVDQMSPQQALPLRRYVRYDKAVYNTASAFVARQFGGKPFVALHWRRTDFLQVRRTQPGVLQSAEELVRHARILMSKARTDQVYLATDCDDPGELGYIEAQLQPIRYLPPPDEEGAGLRSRVETANLEVVICAMAERFLGTKTSSFSLAINEERVAIFGKAPGSGGEMDTLPPATPTHGLKPVPLPAAGGRKDEL